MTESTPSRVAQGAGATALLLLACALGIRPYLGTLGHDPMALDSDAPSIGFDEFALSENRYRLLAKVNPEHADELMDSAQADVMKRWRAYERLATGVES